MAGMQNKGCHSEDILAAEHPALARAPARHAARDSAGRKARPAPTRRRQQAHDVLVGGRWRVQHLALQTPAGHRAICKGQQTRRDPSTSTGKASTAGRAAWYGALARLHVLVGSGGRGTGCHAHRPPPCWAATHPAKDRHPIMPIAMPQIMKLSARAVRTALHASPAAAAAATSVPDTQRVAPVTHLMVRAAGLTEPTDGRREAQAEKGTAEYSIGPPRSLCAGR